MMNWDYCTHNGKEYRYSIKRKPSGRPECAEALVGSVWVRVRNIDTLDGIWNVANGLPFSHNHRKGQ